MRIFIFFLGIFLFLSCQQKKTIERPPNIIFMMSDDHAYQALSAYEDHLIKTPNIDRLGKNGMLFKRAFVTNSICSPSRAVIITGKHSHLNSVRDNVGVFDGSQQTLPKILKANNYTTAVIGKWHLKSEPTGFDYWKVLPGQGHYYNPDFKTPNGQERIEGYVTDIITDLAISWLDNIQKDEKPFFLMYHHKAPHREWLPAPEDIEEALATQYPEPESLFDDYEGRGRAAAEAEMRISDHMGLPNDSKIQPEIAHEVEQDFLHWYSRAYNSNLDRMNPEQRAHWEANYGPINEQFKEMGLREDALTRFKYQRYMQDYLASIKSVDRNVGRLLDYLEDEGLDENTIIVYTSDQGFYLGEHGWFDKRFMYEESFRTPLLMQWKGQVSPGSVENTMVQNLDFAPTFLEAAGIEIPGDMQGISFLPILKGEEMEFRDALFYHYFEYPGIHMAKRHYGVRTDRYKLIHFYNDINEWELYDLQEDPKEMKNLFDDPNYKEVKQELYERLNELATEYQDSTALSQMSNVKFN